MKLYYWNTFNISCFSMNKNKSVAIARLEPMSVKKGFTFEFSALPSVLFRRWRSWVYFRYIKH